MSGKRIRHVDKLRRERIRKFFFRYRPVSTHIFALVAVVIFATMLIFSCYSFNQNLYNIEESVGTYHTVKQGTSRSKYGTRSIKYSVIIDGKEYSLDKDGERGDGKTLLGKFSYGDEITYYCVGDKVVYFKLPGGGYSTSPEEYEARTKTTHYYFVFPGFVFFLLLSIYGWLTNFGDDKNIKHAGVRSGWFVSKSASNRKRKSKEAPAMQEDKKHLYPSSFHYLSERNKHTVWISVAIEIVCGVLLWLFEYYALSGLVAISALLTVVFWIRCSKKAGG